VFVHSITTLFTKNVLGTLLTPTLLPHSKFHSLIHPPSNVLANQCLIHWEEIQVDDHLKVAFHMSKVSDDIEEFLVFLLSSIEVWKFCSCHQHSMSM